MGIVNIDKNKADGDWYKDTVAKRGVSSGDWIQFLVGLEYEDGVGPS